MFENEREDILKLAEEVLPRIYKGELYGELEAIDFVDYVAKRLPILKGPMFELIEKHFGGDMLYTRNLDDYFQALQNLYAQNEITIVRYYGFEGNNEGIDVIETIVEWLEEEK